MLPWKSDFFGQKSFWHDFLHLLEGINIIDGLLNWRYPVFILVLALWIWFSWWLYTREVLPRIHGQEEVLSMMRMETLTMPLAFEWGSSMPIAGSTFDQWKQDVERLDTAAVMRIWRGYYFKDEMNSGAEGVQLAYDRVRRTRVIVSPHRKEDYILIETRSVTGDVRSKPFESVAVDVFLEEDIAQRFGDTLQICFPSRDSLWLPEAFLRNWLMTQLQGRDKKEGLLQITGTADGSGVAESADVALDRAERVQQILTTLGWKDEQIRLTTGQRNHPHTLLNRCVLIVYEAQ